MIKEILKYIDIVASKNNKKVFISKKCPFCGHAGKRPFRYNMKLKVGKSYCCGVSFKTISWLNVIINNRDRYDIQMIINSPFIRSNRLLCVEKHFEDKMSIDNIGFEKSETDSSLPF